MAVQWSKTYSTTKWFEYQVGIDYRKSTETEYSVTYAIDVYFRSNYKVYDNKINVFFNAAENITTAFDDKMTYLVKQPSVNCPNNNGGWPTANTVKVYSTNLVFTKKSMAQQISLAANVGAIYNYSSSVGGVITVLTGLTVPAYSQYTVTYDANGGSNAPSSQTERAGKTLIIAAAAPTREGYTFLGWGLTADADVAAYQAGDTYEAAKSVTLYALWKVLEYTVHYDANGGEGAPAPQTKIYGVDLTVPETLPQFVGYEFLGWSVSATSTAIYKRPGDPITENEDLTLYAVWSSNGMMHVKNADGTVKRGRVWVCTEDGCKQGLPWIQTENGCKKGV